MTQQDRREAFGVRLAAAREAMGLKQRQLADLVGLSGGAIGHMEKGNRGATEPVVRRLEFALRLQAGELGWLLGYDDPPPRAELEAAIRSDPGLRDDYKQALIAVLAEFRRLSQGSDGS